MNRRVFLGSTALGAVGASCESQPTESRPFVPPIEDACRHAAQSDRRRSPAVSEAPRRESLLRIPTRPGRTWLLAARRPGADAGPVRAAWCCAGHGRSTVLDLLAHRPREARFDYAWRIPRARQRHRRHSQDDPGLRRSRHSGVQIQHEHPGRVTYGEYAGAGWFALLHVALRGSQAGPAAYAGGARRRGHGLGTHHLFLGPHHPGRQRV